jgi:GT2 family glycosyltransferase
MKIAIAIATTGRPEVVGQTLQWLERQSRPPDLVAVVGAAEADAPAERLPAGARFVVGRKGSAHQRNHALDMLRGEADIVVFIDDDYVPAADFVAGVERLMTSHPEVVAASGLLLADGVHSRGLSFGEAESLIAAYEREGAGEPWLTDETGTYGCNMAFRIAAAPNARFDENLPLYSWLEDTDYSAAFARVGRVVRTNYFVGVHLGVKSGRASGVKLGYSQIANPIYLVAKGTVRPGFAVKLAGGNLLANLARSIRPEPRIDRRGRLRGNLLALLDALRGRSDPRRVLEL